MLLTVPWCLCTFLGRVDIRGDQAMYSQKPSKLTKGYSFSKTGVECTPEIPRNAKIMMATALVYLVIQGPSFWFQNNKVRGRARAGPDSERP